jgi:uncharacterized membrane protein
MLGSRPRLLAGVAVGIAAYMLLPPIEQGSTRAVMAWDIGVMAFILLAANLFLTATIEQMPDQAERQEEGEWTIFFLTVAVVIVSFVAIVGEFSNIKDLKPGERSLHVALVGVTLFLSWLMTHVTFAFRYAHEYYDRTEDGSGVDGGLDFPGNQMPDYMDFMYFSLVLGMTFQVSDVQITSRKLRRLAALQGLLSFLFNAVIVAVTVNIAAGLL